MSVSRAARLVDIEFPEHAVVIADAALPERYLRALDRPLLVEAGEPLKSLEAVGELAKRVLERRSSRPLVLVGVGGGSVGDAVGFLASVLWRGVGLWHVPTTLLAMVDSAHGGKTAVNLGAMKNQLGTFYTADQVVLVDELVETLPLAQREQGLVELIKALWLGDPGGLDLLDQDGGVGELAAAPFGDVRARLMELLERAIEVKLDVVSRDPRETRGIRTWLNLGHTAAHALELHAGLPHGEAVAWGLMAVAAVSQEQGGFSGADAARLRRQMYPLVHSRRGVLRFEDRAAFEAAVMRDKKRVAGELRSVRLDAPGEPKVTRTISAARWFEALRAEVEGWRARRVRVSFRRPRPARLRMASSKSELNRALAIRAIRPGATKVEGDSDAEDVGSMREAVEALTRAAPGADLCLDAGEGGTTLRFLTALAAARPGRTRIAMHPRLGRRPHDALFDALRAAGATVERYQDEAGEGVEVVGWGRWPDAVEVDASTSSQFASAVAILGATGHDLVVETAGQVASEPYFEMTLAMLERAGVVVERAEGRVALRGLSCEEPTTLVADRDASSAAIWRVAEFLGAKVELADPAPRGWQPDERVVTILEALSHEAAQDAAHRAVFDVGACPDLVPVLSIAALRVPCAVRFEGAAHLRHKESNRIEQLIEAMAGAGLVARALPDGIEVPPGVQAPRNGAVWRVAGDHRLAFAGALAAMACDHLEVDDPWVVAKSYPEFWHACRQAGFSVEPV